MGQSPGPGGRGCSAVGKRRYQGTWCSKCRHNLNSVPYGKPCPRCGHQYRTYGIVSSTTAKGLPNLDLRGQTTGQGGGARTFCGSSQDMSSSVKPAGGTSGSA